MGPRRAGRRFSLGDPMSPTQIAAGRMRNSVDRRMLARPSGRLGKGPQVWSSSVVTSVALLIIAMSCVVGASVTSWHYWQEERRAQQREQENRNQRFLEYWKQEVGKAHNKPTSGRDQLAQK